MALEEMKPRTIVRHCAICGKKILVKVFPGGGYSGGNYFGMIERAENYRETGKTFDLGSGLKADIVEPTGKTQKLEYWECDECHNKPEGGEPNDTRRVRCSF